MNNTMYAIVTITHHKVTPATDAEWARYGWALGSKTQRAASSAADIRATRPAACEGWADEDILCAASLGCDHGRALMVPVPMAYTQHTPDIPAEMWDAVGVKDACHWRWRHSARRHMYQSGPDLAARLPSVRAYRERILAAMSERWPDMLDSIVPPWRAFERRLCDATDAARAQVLRILPLAVALQTPLGRDTPLPLVMDPSDRRQGDASRYRPECELRAALAEPAILTPGGTRSDAEIIRCALSMGAGLTASHIREIMGE